MNLDFVMREPILPHLRHIRRGKRGFIPSACFPSVRRHGQGGGSFCPPEAHCGGWDGSRQEIRKALPRVPEELKLTSPRKRMGKFDEICKGTPDFVRRPL